MKCMRARNECIHVCAKDSLLQGNLILTSIPYDDYLLVYLAKLSLPLSFPATKY